MPTEGFKRLLAQWYRNSYFHNESLKDSSQADPTFDKFNPAANHPDTPQKFSFKELFLPMAPYFSVVERNTKLVTFIVVRYLILLVFAVYHLLNGTYFESRRNRRPENFSRSARVYDILGRHKYDTLVNLNSVADFMLKHTGFDNPSRVLADEVSLYSVTKTEAVFIETNPGVEVWRGKYNSFHGIAQHKHAVRVITMPIAAFYKLADELGDPKGKIVFITNTARCGSTLLSRIYEKTDEFVSLSEPTGINCLRAFVGREDDSWVQYHSRSIIRLLCKPTHLENFAIKITPNSTKIVPLLKRLYPDASFVFIYRDLLPVCRSMYKIWKELPMGRLNIIFAKCIPWFYTTALNFADYYDPIHFTEKIKLIPGYGQGSILWGNVIGMYRRFRANGIDTGGIKYEDLVKDKEFALTRIFEYNDIPKRCIKPALRAFESDSQENSLLSRDLLSKTRLPPLTDAMRTEINKVCAQYNLPKIGDECVLQGTLTREKVPCPHHNHKTN